MAISSALELESSISLAGSDHSLVSSRRDERRPGEVE